MSMGEKLDKLGADGVLHGFTLWRTDHGYQASMQTGAKNSWRIQRGATPSEAIRKVLDMDYVDKIDDASGIAPAPRMTRSEADFADAALAAAMAEDAHNFELDQPFESVVPDEDGGGGIFG